jgi:hypothetical protein
LAEDNSRNLQHPVWNIYDQLRTTRLNVLYYEEKLQFSERLQLFMQIILAATVPSSAIAGFEIWDFWLGKYAWEIFVSSSSLVAFIQPFLGLSKKIKQYDELATGYKVLFYDLQDIRQKIEEDKGYGNTHKKLFKVAKTRRTRLEVKETGIRLNKNLRKRCQTAVGLELPAKQFYIPDES